MDGLSHLTKQYRVMVDLGYSLIILLSYDGGSSLPGYPFRLRISYQDYVETPLL